MSLIEYHRTNAALPPSARRDPPRSEGRVRVKVTWAFADWEPAGLEGTVEREVSFATAPPRASSVSLGELAGGKRAKRLNGPFETTLYQAELAAFRRRCFDGPDDPRRRMIEEARGRMEREVRGVVSEAYHVPPDQIPRDPAEWPESWKPAIERFTGLNVLSIYRDRADVLAPSPPIFESIEVLEELDAPSLEDIFGAHAGNGAAQRQAAEIGAQAAIAAITALEAQRSESGRKK